MAIKANRYYNDPAMAQAAANLTDLFGPPSGSDASGYASARQTDLETDQRQALWDFLKDPNADMQLADRESVIAGLYHPDQSYRSVDVNAETQRYGYDTAAETSRSNNVADNIQLAANNAADNVQSGANNAATNVQSGANNAADNTRAAIIAMHDNLAPGEIRPGYTPEEAEILGVPAMGQVAGAAKPLSETEVKGGLLTALATGKTQDIANELLVKQALLGTEQQATIDPNTNQPVLKNRFDAAGSQPVLSEADQKGIAFSRLPDRTQQQSVVDIKDVDTYHAVNPDNTERSFVGYVGSDGMIYDQADPSKPAKGVVSKGSGGNQFAVDFNADGTVAGIRQGAGVAGGKKTEKMQAAEYAAEMAEGPTRNLLLAFNDETLLPTSNDWRANELYTAARSADSQLARQTAPTLYNQISKPAKMFYQNMKSVLPMHVFLKSGQGVNEKEYWRALDEYMPMPGDDVDIRNLKSRQLGQFILSTYKMAALEPPEDFKQYVALVNKKLGADQKLPGVTAEPAAASPAATAPAAPAAAATAPAAPAAAAAAPAGGVPTPQSQEEFNALKRGDSYIDPDDPVNDDGSPKVVKKK